MRATERTELLLGSKAMEILARSRIAVVGLGGVGGHCAEALARSGVGALHIVDCDTVAESNLNRQLIATVSVIGMKKTDVMQSRLNEVSSCAVTKSDLFVGPDNVDAALGCPPDLIVDAIDSVSGKLALIRYANEHGIPIISCMGSGNRLDPTRFRITDIFATSGCPLARRMRQELRKCGITSLPVVFSDEPPIAQPGQTVIGSFAPVTAAAGLIAASFAVRTLCHLK